MMCRKKLSFRKIPWTLRKELSGQPLEYSRLQQLRGGEAGTPGFATCQGTMLRRLFHRRLIGDRVLGKSMETFRIGVFVGGGCAVASSSSREGVGGWCERAVVFSR